VGSNRGRRGRVRAGRSTAAVVFVLVVGLVVLVGGPPEGIGGEGAEGFPLSWLWSLIPTVSAGWAAPPPGPHQDSGTAAGHAHSAPTSATRAGIGAGRAPGKGKGQLDPYQFRTAAKGTSTTPDLAVRDHFDPATSKRLGGEASSLQDVYANADGTFTRRVSQTPLNYRAKDGSWNPIDTTLTAGTAGRWKQRANAMAVEFAPFADDARLVSVQIDAQHVFAYGLDQAARVPVSVSGSTATYSGVFAGTDVVLQSLPAVVKESVVIHSPDVSTSWVFPLRLTGITPRAGPNGDIELLDEAGTVLGDIPAPFMEDSNFNAQSGEPATSHAVAFSIDDLGTGQYALRLVADSEWIRDPSRIFPITIDPTYTPYYTSGSTYAETSNGGNNSGEQVLKVGTSDGGSTKAYSFLQFSAFGTSFQNGKVTSATLHLFDFWAYNCSAHPFSVNPVMSSWTPAGVTSYPGPSFGDAIGSANLNPGAACTNG
jgi:hypothetical protein